MLDASEFVLCDMQGRLFEVSGEEGYDSDSFIKGFMKSSAAKDLDKPFSFMQWCGEAYIFSRLKEENADDLKSGEVYDRETLYWAGYIYRYWHYYTGESSWEIIKTAPAKTMRTVYLMYHTMSPEMAIDRLKECESREGA